MNRRSWFFLMVFGGLLTAASMYLVSTRLAARTDMATVPLQEVTTPPALEEPPIATSSFTATDTVSVDPATAPATPEIPAVSTSTEDKWISGTEAKRNILFSYHNSRVKEVFLIGEFNDWFREPMKKNAKGVWRVTVKLSPGTYDYMFVVDGKRTRDPNGKKSADGTKSVIVVKPLAKK